MSERTSVAWGVEEEAERIGISVRSLWTLINQHAPPILRGGRRVLFDDLAHRALIEAMRVRPTQAPQPAPPPEPVAVVKPTQPTKRERMQAMLARMEQAPRGMPRRRCSPGADK
ncbi:MAG: hypothetical protein WDN04_15725 [Rhodospirillales bacterium]